MTLKKLKKYSVDDFPERIWIFFGRKFSTANSKTKCSGFGFSNIDIYRFSLFYYFSTSSS